MSQSVGVRLRRLRREQGLTQTQLGGDQYSKSYVSAVEHEKIVPSRDALQFFARQLHIDDLDETSEDDGKSYSLSLPAPSPVVEEQEQEVLALLDLLLQGGDLDTTLPSPILEDLFTHFSEIAFIDSPGLQKRARYMLLLGIQAQKDGNDVRARAALEHVLPLVPVLYQPLVLDALGTLAYREQIYQQALFYHKRAWQALENQEEVSTHLRLRIKLHCGKDYWALSAYTQACEQYEQARQHLRATHNLQIAAELYLGLGYCTYAALFREAFFAQTPCTSTEYTQIDTAFQSATSFLIQSRTLYQVSRDQHGESLARLTQTSIVLDHNLWRITQYQQSSPMKQSPSLLIDTTLLDDAEEQCRQILHLWQGSDVIDADAQNMLYLVMINYTRVLRQRSTIARLNGYHETALKERTLSVWLCQNILEALAERQMPRSLLSTVLSLSGKNVHFQNLALPRVPEVESWSWHAPTLLFEVCMLVAEIAEELGRAGTRSGYVQDCYRRVEQCLKQALQIICTMSIAQETQRSTIVRSYVRIRGMIEERLCVQSELVK